MTLRELHYIVAIDKHRHFAKAAKACFVSQPTLSAQVKKLEQQLDVKLFERSKQGIYVTEVGRHIIEAAKRMLYEERNIKQWAKNFQNPYAGTLRFGAFPTLAPYVFPSLIPIIKQSYHELALYLVEEKTDILLERLLSGDIDMALLALPIDEALFNAFYLFSEPFLLLLYPEHVLAEVETVEQSKLHNEALLLLDEGHCFRTQALEFCANNQINEVVDYRASSLETLRQMVLARSGITLIPSLAVPKTNDGLCYIRFSEPIPSRKIALVLSKQSSKYRLARELAGKIKEMKHFNSC